MADNVVSEPLPGPKVVKEKEDEKIFARITRVTPCEPVQTMRTYTVDLVVSKELEPFAIAEAVVNGLSSKFKGVFDNSVPKMPVG